jgi:DNA-binding transcriptional MerR regulator
LALLTIAQLASELGLPESTVRYYRDRFKDYVPVIGQGRSRRYRPEAAEVLRFIADSFRANIPFEDIETALKARFMPIIEQQQQSVVTQQQSAAVLRDLMSDALREVFDRQEAMFQKELAVLRQEIANLTEQIHQDKQDRNDLEQLILDRDQRLLEQIRSVMEENKKQSWISRLFKK